MPAPRRSAPWTLAALAVVTTLAFGLLAADYLNLRLVLRPDLPAIGAHLALDPLWARVGWTMTVWLGLAGALCLWLREDAAVLVFFAALVAALVTLAGLERSGGLVPALPGLAVAGGAAVLALVAWIHARALKIAGVLS